MILFTASNSASQVINPYCACHIVNCFLSYDWIAGCSPH